MQIECVPWDWFGFKPLLSLSARRGRRDDDNNVSAPITARRRIVGKVREMSAHRLGYASEDGGFLATANRSNLSPPEWYLDRVDEKAVEICANKNNTHRMEIC